MKLVDYNTLAYQFAIRNTRVVELLKSELTDEVVMELLTYGIDATSVYFNEGEEIVINSIQELYLDHAHLKEIKHVPYSPFEPHEAFRGDPTLIHPLKKNVLAHRESDEDAILRIKPLIETRGSKLQRLIDGSTFHHYDEVTFFGNTVYGLDTSGNSAKTIRRDIAYINQWTQPEKYLQLIPQYNSVFL